MQEIYRINKGTLSVLNKTISFYFGLVFEDDGMVFFDFYTPESFNLNSFVESEQGYIFQAHFSMNGVTVDNNQIEATQLVVNNIRPSQSLLKMQSYGYVKHTVVRERLDGEKEEGQDEPKTLFYLELEGLKIEYSDLTEIKRARGGVIVKDFNNWKRDYTSAVLIYDSPEMKVPNNFKFTFFESDKGDNIWVELPNPRNNGQNVLKYETYLEFKKELIFLLSLLNGAEVAVRKEFIGGFYNIGAVSSQTVVTYSFNSVQNERTNQYVPLNSRFHRGENILSSVFLKGFNKYVAENVKLDLNSIIFYLNGAEKAKSLQEKFFVLIIAFERLSQKLNDNENFGDISILPEEDYEPIKKELIELLNKHRAGRKNAIDDLKGRIGNLNKIKKTSTKHKFLRLLEYAKIPRTPEIDFIIDEVRHKSVHEGEIGEGNQALKNYFVLDELLRDIILNLIGYDRSRISRYKPIDNSFGFPH